MLNRIETSLASEGAQNLGLLLLRVFPGLVFTFHGAQKLFGAFGGGGLQGTTQFFESIGIPFASLNAAMAGGIEFFGGLALIAGVATRLVSLPLVVTMIVAIVTVHPSGFDARQGGMEYPLTLAGVTAAVFLLGPGRFRLPIGGLSRAPESAPQVQPSSSN